MKIDATAGRYMLGQQRGRQDKDNSIEPTPANVQEHPQPSQPGPTETPATGEAKAAGAIRNLQEGHYQGVASLRLQMNFHQQLQISGTHEATQMLATSSQTLVIGVEERITSIRDDFADGFGIDFIEQADSLMNTFRSGIEALFSGEVQLSPQSLLADIRDTFGSFFSSFTGLEPLPPSSESDSPENGVENGSSLPLDENVDVVAVPDETSLPTDLPAEDMQPVESLSFTDRLTDLQDWFDEQLLSLQTSVDQFTTLPPIGEKRGNSFAYSRFLAIYNEMNSIDTAPENSDSPPQDGVSTEA